MGLAHQRDIAPAIEELSLGRTAVWLPAELPERTQGRNTATIRAARRPTPNGRAVASDVEAHQRVSLVVVRDGVTESFPLGGSAQVSFTAELATLLAGTAQSSPHGARQGVADELSGAERRVLRFLPTNLTAGEIADELYLSVNTVKTHMRHIYAKFDAHRRREAVERARALGLLPRSKHRVQGETPWPNSPAGRVFRATP
jgi:DNA-binding CsgD family transcriptional regulator